MHITIVNNQWVGLCENIGTRDQSIIKDLCSHLITCPTLELIILHAWVIQYHSFTGDVIRYVDVNADVL